MFSVTGFIAKRYMKSNHESRFFSWISFLSIVGIAIGVAAMIVVLSVINGFEAELRGRFLAANAHVLTYRYPSGMRDFDGWIKRFVTEIGDDASGFSPFVHMETMARSSTTMHQVLAKGIAPEMRKKVQPLEKLIRPAGALQKLQNEIDEFNASGNLPIVPSVILGIGLARTLDVNPGDLIEIISPSSKDPFGSFKNFKVEGIYDSGLKHYDNRIAFFSFRSAQSLFNMPSDIVTGIEIGLYDPNESDKVADHLTELFSNIYIKQWKNYNRNIFEAMETERFVIGVIVALVAFVASFNILTTLFVSVSQKQKDISILKALGASNAQILRLFLKQSLYIGLMGCSIGITLALVISKILENYQFVELPDIYLLAALPISYDWRVYSMISLGGILICLVAGIYPAWSASRVSPTEGLRAGDT